LPQEVGDIGAAPRAQVVDDDDGVAVGDETTAEVAPDEAGTTGDHDLHRAEIG
jgi:hypothetical protein